MASSIRQGELASRLGVHREIDGGAVEEQRRNFQLRPGRFSALDFVGASDALGLSLPEVDFARRHLSRSDAEPLGPTQAGTALHNARVRRMKRRVRTQPYDAYAWVDLALAYSSLGQIVRAVSSIDVALSVAPGDRFVLRAATRLFVHIDDLDRAFDVISSAPALNDDPWLLAPAIATAELSDRRLNFSRAARTILIDSSWSDRARSELASQLGTLELRAGKPRNGKALVSQSLVDPNDNSVAQAVWANKRFGVEVEKSLVVSTPLAFEARARAAAEEWDWPAAIQHALMWLDDQPYSTGAGAYIGWIAAIADDYFEEAAEALRLSRVANPADAVLRNNLAYCLIQLGLLEEAAELLEGSEGERDVDFEVLQATRGLYQYRLGNWAEGKAMYQAAIAGLSRAGANELADCARLFWLLEQVRVVPGASIVVEEALGATATSGSSDVQYLRDRLRRLSR